MNILAIDPGPNESAFVIWDGSKIWDMDKLSNYELLDFLRIRAFKVLPSALIVEQIKSYGMAVSDSIFDTVFWSGRFCEAWDGAKFGFWDRLPRMQVKMHLCHNSRAKDANIRQALIDRIGEQGKKANPGPTYGVKGDIWAALAVAVYAWDIKLFDCQ